MRNSFKKIIVVGIAFRVLIVLGLMIPIIIPVILIAPGFPGFFKQQRPGLNEKPSTLFKFRTVENFKGNKEEAE